MSGLDVGTPVEKYVVRGVLGSGGMATVYVVEHQVLGSLHALKVLQEVDDAIRRRLIREGRVQARLDHPNVVPVQDVLDIGGRPGLLMPLVEGPDLARLIAHRGALPQAAVAYLFREIARGVGYAHQHGVVHRDLKPANVLLDVRHHALVARVADFGLATAAEGDASGETRTGIFMGTPAYAAPEQFADAATVDHRADLWSLGCVLYQMLVGVAPFTGTVHELVRQIGTADFRDPLDADPTLDPRWGELVRDLLVVDRDARLADATTLLARIDDFVDPTRADSLSGDLLAEARALLDEERAATDGSAVTAASGRPWSGSMVAPTATSMPIEPMETVASAPSASTLEVPTPPRRASRRLGVVLGLVAAVAVAGTAAWVLASSGGAAAGLYDDIAWTAAGWTGVGSPRDGVGDGYRLRTTDDGALEVTRVNAAGQPAPFRRAAWGQVERPTIVKRDASGTPCSGAQGAWCQGLLELGEAPEATTHVVRTDDSGRVSEVERRDAWGHVLGRIEVTPTETGARLRHLGAAGMPAPSPDLQVAVEEHVYDEQGRVARTTWFDEGGVQVIRAIDGSMGHALRYDGQGRLVERTFVDADAAPMRGIGNLISTTWTYGDPAHPSLPTEERSTGPGGVPVPGDSGCEVTRLTWAGDGTLAEARCGGAGGALQRFDHSGCGVLEWSTTAGGKRVRCLDANGPTYAKAGWSALDLDLDAQGRITAIRHLDVDGEQTSDVWGIGRYVLARDERGLLVSAGPHEDAAGAPLAIPGVLATWRRTLRDGLETQRMAIGADGAPADLSLGWVARTVERDAHGAITALAWFDAVGEPAITAQGIHRIVWEYDARGGVAVDKVFGPDGEPTVRAVGGSHEVRYERDFAGRLVADRHFDTEGRPMLTVAIGTARDKHFLGYHSGRAIRDALGRVVRLDFVDTEDKPVVHSLGYASEVKTYDAFGRNTSVRYLDAEGQPTIAADGTAGFDQEWGPRPDEIYNRVGISVDTKGMPVARRAGVNSRTCAILRNEVLEIDGPWEKWSSKCFGPGDVPVASGLGAHETVGWAMSSGREGEGERNRELSLYDEHGEPAVGYTGFHRRVRRFDALGRPVESTIFAPPGDVVIGRFEAVYEARGNLVRLAYHDGEGNLFDPPPGGPAPERHAVIEHEFDDMGRRVETRWIRADGTMGGYGRPPIERYAYEQAVRDDSGWRPTRTSTHDAHGDPLEIDGIASRTVSYDRFGRETRRATWDASGGLANDERGIAMVELAWDPRGLHTLARYTDADGAPVKGPEGCAEWTAAYDHLGRRAEWSCDGVVNREETAR